MQERTYWNWQLFAEGAEGTETTSEAAEPAQRAFTQADIDRIVQKTIRAERLRAEKLAEEARAEAERLAGENIEAQVRRAAEKRERELAAREEIIGRRELRTEALETLARKGLPGELAGTLDYSDAESVRASMEGVEAVFRSAVQRGVEERLRGAELPIKGMPGARELSKLTDEEYYRTMLNRATKE